MRSFSSDGRSARSARLPRRTTTVRPGRSRSSARRTSRRRSPSSGRASRKKSASTGRTSRRRRRRSTRRCTPTTSTARSATRGSRTSSEQDVYGARARHRRRELLFPHPRLVLVLPLHLARAPSRRRPRTRASRSLRADAPARVPDNPASDRLDAVLPRFAEGRPAHKRTVTGAGREQPPARLGSSYDLRLRTSRPALHVLVSGAFCIRREHPPGESRIRARVVRRE